MSLDHTDQESARPPQDVPVRVHLLAEDAPKGQHHLICCRNVLIYFRDAMIKAVVDSLAETLSIGGYLLIGASESLLRITTRFELVEVGGAFMYVKL